MNWSPSESRLDGGAVEQNTLPDSKPLWASRFQIIQGPFDQALRVDPCELRHVFPFVAVAVPGGAVVVGADGVSPDRVEDVALWLKNRRVADASVLLEGVTELMEQGRHLSRPRIDIVHAAVRGGASTEIRRMEKLHPAAELGDDPEPVPVLDRDALEPVQYVSNVGVGDGWVGADVDVEGEGMRLILGRLKLDVVLGQRVVVIEVVGAGLRAAVRLAAGGACDVEADALFTVCPVQDARPAVARVLVPAKVLSGQVAPNDERSDLPPVKVALLGVGAGALCGRYESLWDLRIHPVRDRRFDSCVGFDSGVGFNNPCVRAARGALKIFGSAAEKRQ